MSMQALNQLVARSIVDPGVIQAFSSGSMTEIIADLDFTAELRTSLGQLEASTFTEFAIKAYRLVKVSETLTPRIELPSPLTGLLPNQERAEGERAA